MGEGATAKAISLRLISPSWLAASRSRVAGNRCFVSRLTAGGSFLVARCYPRCTWPIVRAFCRIEIVRDALALCQLIELLTFNHAVVKEHVLATVLRRDEADPFLGDYLGNESNWHMISYPTFNHESTSHTATTCWSGFSSIRSRF